MEIINEEILINTLESDIVIPYLEKKLLDFEKQPTTFKTFNGLCHIIPFPIGIESRFLSNPKILCHSSDIFCNTIFSKYINLKNRDLKITLHHDSAPAKIDKNGYMFYYYYGVYTSSLEVFWNKQWRKNIEIKEFL